MRLLISIAILLSPLKAMACGLSWSEPVSHFENVDFQGNVHIVRKLGEVEKLPIYLIFNSSYAISPYAGSGFEIPLLESRMWQVDENRFRMKSPDGWLWIFQRTKMPNVLEGNAGWKGLIKADSITVWAPCGDKISFKNGRIVSMQLKDEKFDYAYKGARVDSIQQNGRTILEVKSDDKTGDVTGINLPSIREQIGLLQTTNRPKVNTVSGEKIVSRVDRTLGEVKKSDGSKENFEFSVDEHLNPTLFNNGIFFTWNSETNKIIRSNDFTYKVISAPVDFVNFAIERKNTKTSQAEFWDCSASSGVEVVTGHDGIKRTTRRFTSGILAGKLRDITEEQNGSRRVIFRANYDELGNLLSFGENAHSYRLHYKSDGSLDSFTVDKKASIRITDL